MRRNPAAIESGPRGKSSPSQRGEQIFNGRIVAKRAAKVDIPIHIPRSEHEAAAELKGILSQLILPVASRARAFAARFVFAPQHVQKVGATQTGNAVRLALLIDQEREPNARVLPELARVIRVAESDGRQLGAPLAESLLVFAQLRDVLAAEDSTVVAQENYHRRLPLPKRAQADLAAIRTGQHHRSKRFGDHL